MFEAVSVTFMCTHRNIVSTSTISLCEAVNEHSYCPTLNPSELLLTCTKNIVTSVLHISKRNCTQEHLNHDVFPVDFYDDITGDSKQRNTVLPPVKQLNVSYLLSTDLKEV